MKFILFSISAVCLALLDLLWGSQPLDYGQIFTPGTFDNAILFNFRIPKVIAAILSGVALASSGLLMQTIFRNPLAGPYMLGVSSGASLGVAMFMMTGGVTSFALLHDLGVATSAWIGAVAVLLLVMVVSTRLKDIMAVLILGMMIGSAASAFVDVLQFFSNEAALKGFVIWSMGSVSGLSTLQLVIMGGCIGVGLLMSIGSIKQLDLILLGENYARTMGVNIMTTRVVVFIATSLLAGSVTAFCGPIAFIGIAAPHVARMIFRRASHRQLLPASIIVGINMMLICDIISGMPTSDMVLPLNTVAALLGIPVVIMVVAGNRNYKIM